MPEGIADLSYRHYAGQMAAPRSRWKVIAKMGIRNAFKTRSFWVYTLMSSWYHVLLVSFLYILEQSVQAVSAGGSGGGRANFAERIFERLIWGDEVVTGISLAQLLIVITTMVIGAGCIANDNRSNALLVYLSRPCSRGSYLFGKWMGLFVPLLITVGLPPLLFYFYGVMNYRPQGFLSDDPWLIVKIGVTVPLIAAFYTSLMVGISSMFRQPRMASAIFFGLYILSFFFSSLMRGLATSQGERIPPAVQSAAEQASYLSISGLMQGLTKIIFNTNGSVPFGGEGGMVVPRPDLVTVLVPALLIVGISLLIASSRIRAVEVVK
jgi:ABC-2 type transport system permease protein